jgi:hypothetical protein
MWVIASTTCFLYLLPPRLPPSERLRLCLEPNLFTYNTPHSQPQSHFIPTYLWRLDRQSIPKRWHLNYRRRGTTQKKAYDITSFQLILKCCGDVISPSSEPFYPVFLPCRILNMGALPPNFRHGATFWDSLICLNTPFITSDLIIRDISVCYYSDEAVLCGLFSCFHGNYEILLLELLPLDRGGKHFNTVLFAQLCVGHRPA